MSALDRAYIRAYARGPAQPSTSAVDDDISEPGSREATRLPASHSASSKGAELESIYAAGALYRVDWPSGASNEVPAPHAAPNQRRLRFSAPCAAPVAQAPVRIRKPIHTGREPLAVVAAKLRNLRHDPGAVVVEPDELDAPALQPIKNSQSSRDQGSQPTGSQRALDLTSQVQVSLALCDEQAIPPAMVVSPLPEGRPYSNLAPSLLSRHFDSFSAAEDVTKEADAEVAGIGEASPVPDRDKQKQTLRLDGARASTPKPHFGRKSSGPIAAASSIPESESAQSPPPEPALADEQLTQPAQSPVVPLVPVWEVDAFQWPAVCERLLAGDQSHFAHSGEKLRSAVQDGLRVLGVAATRKGDGATTLALCLARSAAKAGLNVALIDADLNRPELADCLGLEVECDWRSVAVGRAPLPEAAIKSLNDQLTVFPIKSEEKQPLTLADSRVGELFRTIAKSFDLVLVDLGHVTGGTGPVLPQAAPAAIDAAVVVRDARSVTESSARIVGLKLHAAGIEAVGLAENFREQIA